MRDILGEIHEKLLEIEQKENVTILLAVESGSRAWGFASPDSDYDVRFIYARRPKDYLKLKEEKDVIEWQLDDLLQMELPKGLRRGIEELLEIKKATDEKERKPQMPVIIEFIREELKRQKQIADAMEDDRRGEWDTLDKIYRKQILFAE